MMRPETEVELAALVAEARGPLLIRGGGTRGVAGPGDLMETGGLSGVTLYEPGALTLVARAGTPLAEVEKLLATAGQRLAFEPSDWRALLGSEGEPTLGGAIAANASGPRRVQAGAARDFLLGVRFVDGMGRIVKNGGRVMKNVTGYDLTRLMAGSWGSLGVMTEVGLKVLPRPEDSVTLAIGGLTAEGAVDVMATALGSPFDVSGAGWVGGQVFLRIEGFAGSVAYRADALARLVAPWGQALVVEDCWRDFRDVTAFAGNPGDVWRVSTRASDAAGIIARARADEVMLDWGGGLVWLRVAEGTDLRGRIAAFTGHATLVRAGAETHRALARLQPEPPAVAALTQGIRAKFDPRGIFNPGVLG